jgi:hypothetical protein
LVASMSVSSGIPPGYTMILSIFLLTPVLEN